MELTADSKDYMRSKIIKGATGVFSKFGFKKTSMEDIAKALYIGKSSLYYYFKNKESVFEVVVEQEAAELRSKSDQIIESTLDTSQKLKEYVKLRMILIKELGNYFEILKNDDLKNIYFTEEIRRKYDKDEQSIIERILQEGVNEGHFIIKDVKTVSKAFQIAMKGFEFPMVLAHLENADVENMIDKLINILFYGIVKR